LDIRHWVLGVQPPISNTQYRIPVLLRLAMQRMRTAARTVLLQLHTPLGVLAILLRGVIPFLALSASQGHHDAICFLSRSHIFLDNCTLCQALATCGRVEVPGA